MANKVRARVEAKSLPANATKQERDQAFKLFLSAFKKRCEDYGIKKAYKEHEFFERKPEKDRRKRKEAALRRAKEEAMASGRVKIQPKNKKNNKSQAQ